MRIKEKRSKFFWSRSVDQYFLMGKINSKILMMHKMIRSRAPLRISFAGGGTDIKNYFEEHEGVVISSTIGQYAYTTLLPRNDMGINIKEEDFGIDYSISTTDLSEDKGSDFFNAIIKHFSPKQGFDLLTHSDTKYGSGLGSSSAMMVSLVGAFNRWLNLQMNEYEVADTAYKIEREDLRISGGMQDQYAASFGGFNFIEFKKDKVVVNRMKLKRSVIFDLQFRMIMVNLGSSRFSGNIIDNQIEKLSNEEILEHYDHLKRIAVHIKEALFMERLDDIGPLLREEWQHKQQLSSQISNKEIEKFFNLAEDSGALGYKLLGAGGGGYALLFTDERRRHSLIKSLNKQNFQVSNIEFIPTGLETWNMASSDSNKC